MFTGIVEEMGTVKNIERGSISARIEIKAKKVLEGTKIGDSIAVNGVCLTVVKMGTESFTADVMAETLNKTNLGYLKSGEAVNLERALRLGDRLGGHLVSGHVDGVGSILRLEKKEISTVIFIKAPGEVMRYVIKKGSIAVDGTSLTVVDASNTYFWVSLIPHTLNETVLGKKRPGDLVNLECDIIGKYVDKLLSEGRKNEGSKIDTGFLAEHGFL